MKEDMNRFQGSSLLSLFRSSRVAIRKRFKFERLRDEFIRAFRIDRKLFILSACLLLFIVSLIVGSALFGTRPYIGVEIGEYFSVVEVRDGGPAADSGLAVGDEIIGCGDEIFTHFFDFERRIVKSDINDGLKLKVLKGSEIEDIIVLVERAPFSPTYIVFALISLLLVGYILFILIEKKFDTTVSLLFLLSICIALFVFSVRHGLHSS